MSTLCGKKVLVVDDNHDNQQLVKLFLSKRGMLMDFAENGKEGVSKAMSAPYDVILMDIQMPMMDGYSATKYLRQHGYVKPIIALTAHTMNEERKRCLSVGCNDYLVKPIDSPALYSTIAKYV